MKTFFTLLGVFLTGTLFSQAPSPIFTVLFDSDQSNLNNLALSELSQVKTVLDTTELCELLLIGHTDSDGGDGYNMELSKKRVQNIKQYFLEQGVSESKIRGISKGEKVPLVSNNHDEGKSKNRRVEISFTKCPDTLSMAEYYPLDSLYNQFKKAPEWFVINTEKDTLINTTYGTTYFIPANAFTNKAQPIKKGSIYLEITEFYSKSECLLNNLTTVSNGKMLETGGMFYINATQNGKPLKLVRKKEIKILGTTTKVLDNGRLFKGVREAHNGALNWNLNQRGALDYFPLQSFLNCCGTIPGRGDCPFFFCKINRFFTGKSSSPSNSSLWRSRRRSINEFNCDVVSDLFQEYKVESMEELQIVLNNLLESDFDLTNPDEFEAAMKARIKYKVRNGTANLEELSILSISTSQLGYINCDRFINVPKEDLITLKIKDKYNEGVDVKLVFSNINSILPASVSNKKYSFSNIPKDEEAWVVAMKEDQNGIYLSMEKVSTSVKVVSLNFVEVTAEEFLEKMKILDT